MFFNYIRCLTVVVCGLVAVPAVAGELEFEANERVQGGSAGVDGHMYANGKTIVKERARSSSKLKGVKADYFLVFVDVNGNAIFTSKIERIPTVCGHWDTCPSRVEDNEELTVPAEVAKRTVRIDAYISGYGGNANLFEKLNNAAKDAVRLWDSVDPRVKALIVSQM